MVDETIKVFKSSFSFTRFITQSRNLFSLVINAIFIGIFVKIAYNLHFKLYFQIGILLIGIAWMYYYSILAKKFKVYVKKEEVEVETSGIKEFRENTYNYFTDQFGNFYNDLSYHFTKQNIKNITEVHNSNELKNKYKFSKYFSTDLKKMVRIDFNKPLESTTTTDLREYEPLSTIYLSLENPKKFIAEMKLKK